MHRARTAYSIAVSPARQRNFSKWLVQKATEKKVNKIKENKIREKQKQNVR